MHDVLLLVVELASTIALSAWIVCRDVKRLGPEQLARAWPEASLWSAVVCFSPLCIPLHFVRTRRSLSGIALGLGWLLVAVSVVNGLAWAIDTVLGG